MINSQLDALKAQLNVAYFRSGVFNHTYWMGVKAAKCPTDMWVYQELMAGLKTDLLIETGTWHGGSALFFAQVMDLMDRGKVITVDIEEQPNRPQHPRINYITGSSTDPDVVESIAQASAKAQSTLVILDSDHRAEHKLAELHLYQSLVSVGSYLIAEDTCFDYFPAWPEFGAGPAIAVRQFLDSNKNYVIDRAAERHMLTFCPAGFLRRTG